MTIAEINQQNEEFLNKIINESAMNQKDEVNEPVNESVPTQEIPEGDVGDPTVCELEMILSYGEVMKMGFTRSVFDDLMGNFADIKEMVNLMHHQMVSVFKGEHVEEIKKSAVSALEDLGIPVEKYDPTGEQAVIYMLTDLLCIYMEISHMLGEKQLITETFNLFMKGSQSDDIDNQTECEDN